MLFSEPKIPQFYNPHRQLRCVRPIVSVLFSEPKIPQFTRMTSQSSSCGMVSVLFSEPKIHQFRLAESGVHRSGSAVSVLFSEPKIPQLVRTVRRFCPLFRFSALQRAENSSISTICCSCATLGWGAVSVLFSEPKIPQFICSIVAVARTSKCFSALQRAENSSISTRSLAFWRSLCFSALQRAENSSIAPRQNGVRRVNRFSALQRAENSSIKIVFGKSKLWTSFSALQRAENSSIVFAAIWSNIRLRFQCSSASRKFLNSRTRVQLP